ncbi:glycoside hydrolase family 97 catalytic domain-containing protein [Streptomyces sp. NPDC004539]|uniref:glycoside hydrolase family 97 catalytic domain-containing protein n=1 Tax=Streptomyces sp. NPDC004539 TaxID=3154280 RepID=UPI0033BF571E
MNQSTPGGLPRRTVIAAASAAVPLIAAGPAQAAAGSPSAATGSAGPIAVTSPKGAVTLTLDATTGTPAYSIAVHGTLVVPPSPLGLALDDADFTTGLTVTDRGRTRRAHVRYELLQGKVARVRKTAATRTVTLRTAQGLIVQAELWADEEGAAFRLRFPDRGARTVTRETTGLTLTIPADGGEQFTQPYTLKSPKYQEWYVPRADHTTPVLGKATTSTGGASFPLLARTEAADGTEWWVLASESGADGTYPACHLRQPVTSGGRVTYPIAFPADDEALGNLGPGTPRVTGAWHTPWRFVAVAKTPAQLADTTLATDLAVPSKVRDTSWITPGAASFSWLTAHDSPTSLEQSLRWFDLAKAMGWPYALVDAKWDTMTDASGARVPLERIVAEAGRRGLKLFLWFNSGGENNDSASSPRDRIADRTVRRATFRSLADLGVAGVKADVWQSDKQQLLARQRELLEDAAEFRLHVVLHNTTVPRGWDRTYPHLLGVEAGIASEYYANAKPYADQIPEQTTIAAITRNAVGAFDYGTTLLSPYVDPANPRRTTAAHELALTVVYQSGFNGYADSPDTYLAQPAAVRELLSTVPVAWDETRHLAADPGGHLVVARRKGRTWYVAGVNGRTTSIAPGLDSSAPAYFPPTGEAREFTLALHELGLTRATARLFTDTSPTDGTLKLTTRRASEFTIPTAPFGGFLLVI